MDQREAAELMRLTSEHMTREGMGAIVGDIIADTPEDEPPSRQLLRMLDALDTQLRAKDSDTRLQIVGRLSEFASGPDGQMLEGLWLEPAPAHRDLLGGDRLDMAEGAPLRGVIAQLALLRRELALELDEDVGLDA
jgi:hypothetical protein